MDLNNFLILFIFSITIPILYIKLVSCFVVSIIDRLINANFELNLNKFINLVIGYGIGALLFSYIFRVRLNSFDLSSLPENIFFYRFNNLFYLKN